MVCYLLRLQMRSTLPMIVVLEKQRHSFDPHFPTNEGLVHAVQFGCSNIIINGLGDGQEAVDLKLFQPQLLLKFLDAKLPGVVHGVLPIG